MLITISPGGGRPPSRRERERREWIKKKRVNREIARKIARVKQRERKRKRAGENEGDEAENVLYLYL